MPSPTVVTVSTMSGSLALWRGSAFGDVAGHASWEEDHAAWEARVDQRLDEAIASGELVPVGIQGDGAFGVRVALAPDGPTAREDALTFLTSEPYLLVADGGPVHLGGIEHVGHAGSSPLTIAPPAGRYAVRVAVLDWDQEPGARLADGSPGPDALADFLVLVAPSDGTEAFRTSTATFDPVR